MAFEGGTVGPAVWPARFAGRRHGCSHDSVDGKWCNTCRAGGMTLNEESASCLDHHDERGEIDGSDGRMRDVIRLYQKFKYVGICTTVEVVNESGHLDSVG